jgi:tetratricopeptide (TPR) repeat protein
MQDYYQILGISPNATSGQVKIAYRRLVFQYHPDRNPHDQLAQQRFVEIVEAYSVLSNTVKRSKYDNGIDFNQEAHDTSHNQKPRRPPPHFYYTVKPEKRTYSKRDYILATLAVIVMIFTAVVAPIYLMQTTSDRYYNLAVSNYFAGKYYTALHNIDLSIRELSTNNDEACALASVILVHKLQKYDFAIRYIDRGFNYDPQDSLASELHYLKGICYTKTARPQEALTEFGKVKNYNNTYDSSLYRSAAILIFHESEVDSAEALINELLQRNEQNYGADYLRGIIFEMRSESRKAHKTFRNLIGKPFNQAAIYYHLAKAEIKLNQSDSACTHLKIASAFNLTEAKQLMSLYCKKESIFLSPYD